ncbi:MAG: histidine kinase [Epsilonproteobacteria bacterium]|nr:MAG: histidine kinase [Campylobacterota bacterium]
MQVLLLLILLNLQLFSMDVKFSEEEKLWIKQNPVITYVGDPDWLPFEAFNNGRYMGIVADLIKHIENTTPLKFKIIETSSWEESIEIVNSKKVMLMSQSQDFNKKTTQLFTEIYYKNPIVIIMDKRHRYVSSLYAIDDKQIAISIEESFFQKIQDKHPDIKFRYVKNIKDGLSSVVFGESDAFVHTLAQASYAIAKLQLNDLRIVGRTEFNTKLGFGVSQEHPLLKSIMDKVLQEIGPDVQNDILAKWIHQEYVEKPDYEALFIALAIFALILIMAILFHLKVKKETKAKEKAQNKMLKQQSKMASMGEMLDSVAHQWKQPLNALTMYLDLMKSDFDDGVVDKAYINEMQEGMNSQINHMTTTLSEFRNFFRPKAEVVNFNLLDTVNSVLLLTKDEFLKNQISLVVEIDKEIALKGNENEFKHLIINIINNSKDAFNDKEIKNRHIDIRAIKKNSSLRLEIEDNAGGIPEYVIECIFESNFTTKSADKGTGIGLYMSSQIVDKMSGKMSVKNINNGACFYIVFDI